MTPVRKKEETGGHRRAVIFAAFGALAVGCGMLIAAMVIPPPGKIDNSVLVAFGEILTFSGTLLGLKNKVITDRKINSDEKDR